MSDIEEYEYLMKCLGKGVADTDQQQDAAEHIQKLEANLAKALKALDVYADPCDAEESTPCGYEGNMCCRTARDTLAELTGGKDE